MELCWPYNMTKNKLQYRYLSVSCFKMFQSNDKISYLIEMYLLQATSKVLPAEWIDIS